MFEYVVLYLYLNPLYKYNLSNRFEPHNNGFR